MLTAAKGAQAEQAHLDLGDGRGLGGRSQQAKAARAVDRALPAGDAAEEDAGLRHECPKLVALAKEEQREQLEAVRSPENTWDSAEDQAERLSSALARIGPAGQVPRDPPHLDGRPLAA